MKKKNHKQALKTEEEIQEDKDEVSLETKIGKKTKVVLTNIKRGPSEAFVLIIRETCINIIIRGIGIRDTSPISFNVESDFIMKTMRIPMINFTDEHESTELSSKLQELLKIKSPDKIHLDTLKNWICQEWSRTTHLMLGYSTSSVAVLCSAAVILVFLILYWRYKKISEIGTI